jgi:hypothetical protein
MQITRMDLADKGSPEGIVMAILKAEPNSPIPVPIEELCRRLHIIEIQALTTAVLGQLFHDATYLMLLTR